MSRSFLRPFALVVVALVPLSVGQAPALAQPAPKAPAAPAPAKAAAPKSLVAIVGATVETGKGPALQDAVVLVEGERVVSVTAGGAAPGGATIVDGKGKVVTCGFVDALTSIGLAEVDLEDDARDDNQGGQDRIRAGFRAEDAYNPLGTVGKITRREGVTSVGVIPTGGLFSGQSLWADLDGEVARDAVAKAPLALHVHIESGGGPASGGRGTSILRIREAFDDARVFQKNRASWERNQSRELAPSRLDLEAIVRALGGGLPVVFHVDRAADILTVLGLAKEFALRPIIAGGAEAWRVAGELAAAKVPVIVHPLLPGPTSFDTLGARDDNAARLAAAGVQVGISTQDTHNARKLRQEVGNAIRAGLPREAALASVTRVPAEAFGLGDRYGTLEKGHIANLVVWSGDPFEIATRATAVMIRGRWVTLESRQGELFEKYRAAHR